VSVQSALEGLVGQGACVSELQKSLHLAITQGSSAEAPPSPIAPALAPVEGGMLGLLLGVLVLPPVLPAGVPGLPAGVPPFPMGGVFIAPALPALGLGLEPLLPAPAVPLG